MYVLAVDPGRGKCGIAIVSFDTVAVKRVVERESLLAEMGRLLAQYGVNQIVLGDGTGSGQVLREIGERFPQCVVHVVDEHLTTEEARKEYWRDNKPRGWRRLLPISMQVPPEPYDDYVAVILARRFLEIGRESEA